MARNTTPAPQSKEEPANNAAIAAEMDATNQLAVIERNRQEIQVQAEQEKAELMDLGRRLGQMETAAFVGNISDGILMSAYENVKKSKAWKLLRNRSGEIFPNLDAFCQERLGFSAKRLSQIHGNREALGQETFEQAERLGLRQVDYNAIKGLPAPDQELVRRAVEEAKSRDEVLDLLQELAGRHANEKAAFAKQADEHVQEHAATTKRLEVVTKQKEAAEAKAARIAVMKPDEALQHTLKEATAVMHDAAGAISGGVRQALIALNDVPEGAPNQAVFMAGLLGQLQAELNALRDEFRLPDVSNANDQRLAAEMAEWDKE